MSFVLRCDFFGLEELLSDADRFLLRNLADADETWATTHLLRSTGPSSFSFSNAIFYITYDQMRVT